MASGSDSCAFFYSLTQFFDRAREEEFFKSIIQIPDLPDVSFWMCFHTYISVQTFGISCHKSSHFYFLPHRLLQTSSALLPWVNTKSRWWWCQTRSLTRRKKWCRSQSTGKHHRYADMQVKSKMMFFTSSCGIAVNVYFSFRSSTICSAKWQHLILHWSRGWRRTTVWRESWKCSNLNYSSSRPRWVGTLLDRAVSGYKAGLDAK